jgi:predicted transcriptional regulator
MKGEKHDGLENWAGLSSQQVQAAHLLAEGRSRAKTAAELGIYRDYVYQWLKEKNFRDYLDLLLSESRDQTRARLKELANSTLDALKEIIEDSKEQGSVRVAACSKVLGFIMGETVQLEDRDIPKTAASCRTDQERMKAANDALRQAYGLSPRGGK